MTPITALTDLNQLPNQLQDQQTFDTNMAYMVDMYPERARQENGLAAEMMDMLAQASVIAAGGAFAIPYVFDATTTDADPGAGKLRLSSTTQSAATVMRLDLTSAGQDYTTLIDTFDDSSSSVKGSIRLVKQGDLTKWMTFNLTALATPSGYRNLTVVCTDSSTTSPFANGDALMLSFQRTGDKGDKPLGGAMVCLVSATVAGVNAINYLNIFTNEYDHYLIDFSEYLLSAGSATLYMRLGVAGNTHTGANYTSNPVGSSSDPSSPVSTAFALSSALSGSVNSPGVSIDVLNTSSNNSPTLARISGIHRGASAFDTKDGLMMLNINSVITGFQLYASTGVIAAGKLRVYGYRNQVGVA
ncbi:hypothetical protein IFT64_11960 [Oxalobacteraceae sp. CFBP 8753]|nr:hypothetical protein [Oxalobacteraceae sp. CFBP 8753]